MHDRLSLTNFYNLIDGAIDGWHFDQFSFQFSDFPDWIINKTCKVMYVNDMEANTPDLISFLYYGDETFFWIICLANKISDPFKELPVGTKLCIPDLNAVMEYVASKNTNSVQSSALTSSNSVVSLN